MQKVIHRVWQLLEKRKMTLILTVSLKERKTNLLIHIKIGQMTTLVIYFNYLKH